MNFIKRNYKKFILGLSLCLSLFVGIFALNNVSADYTDEDFSTYNGFQFDWYNPRSSSNSVYSNYSRKIRFLENYNDVNDFDTYTIYVKVSINCLLGYMPSNWSNLSFTNYDFVMYIPFKQVFTNLLGNGPYDVNTNNGNNFNEKLLFVGKHFTTDYDYCELYINYDEIDDDDDGTYYSWYCNIYDEFYASYNDSYEETWANGCRINSISYELYHYRVGEGLSSFNYNPRFVVEDTYSCDTNLPFVKFNYSSVDDSIRLLDDKISDSRQEVSYSSNTYNNFYLTQCNCLSNGKHISKFKYDFVNTNSNSWRFNSSGSLPFSYSNSDDVTGLSYITFNSFRVLVSNYDDLDSYLSSNYFFDDGSYHQWYQAYHAYLNANDSLESLQRSYDYLLGKYTRLVNGSAPFNSNNIINIITIKRSRTIN